MRFQGDNKNAFIALQQWTKMWSYSTVHKTYESMKKLGMSENGTVATRRCQNSKNMTRFYMVPEELKLP